MKFKTTLEKHDILNLRHALSLHGEQFEIFYYNLEEQEQKYLHSLLETHRLDILDYAFELDYKGTTKEMVELIKKVK